MAQPAGGPLPRGLSSLVNVAGGFIAASLAPSTRRIYAQAVVQLRDFAVTVFPGSSWFPTSVPLLCTFVAHLLSTGLAPTSVTSRMSAIACFHKLFHLPDPTGDFFVRRISSWVLSMFASPLPYIFYTSFVLPPVM